MSSSWAAARGEVGWLDIRSRILAPAWLGIPSPTHPATPSHSYMFFRLLEYLARLRHQMGTLF